MPWLEEHAGLPRGSRTRRVVLRAAAAALVGALTALGLHAGLSEPCAHELGLLLALFG